MITVKKCSALKCQIIYNPCMHGESINTEWTDYWNRLMDWSFLVFNYISLKRDTARFPKTQCKIVQGTIDVEMI